MARPLLRLFTTDYDAPPCLALKPKYMKETGERDDDELNVDSECRPPDVFA